MNGPSGCYRNTLVKMPVENLCDFVTRWVVLGSTSTKGLDL